MAHRLTHDDGVITTPRFSPDGRWIAYTSTRSALRDVFVVSAKGGEPRQLTYEASSFVDGDLVVAWTPDSKRVIFLSHRETPVSKLIRAFSISVEGGLAKQLPLDRAGMMSFAPGGQTIAYNRIFRNLELRKRYIGGQAQDIYTYNFGSRTLHRITDWKGTNTAPMWFGNKIYFLSDRGSNFRENIWSFDLVTKGFRQITDFLDYDIDWPSIGGSTITFQQGGRLFAIDLPSEQLREIKVDVPFEDARIRPRSVLVGQYVRVTDATGGIDYAISPKGDSLLVSARGDLFRLALNSHLPAQNLTKTPGVDEDHPSWSPDGQSIAYQTDGSGDQELAVRSSKDGSEQIVTHFANGYLYSPVWSPEGDSMAIADANHSLWWVRLDGSPPQKIASDPFAEIRDAAFSPDGRWLAYSTQRSTQVRAIHLHELLTGHDTIVSSFMENDRSPVFTSDGRRLVFISKRKEQTFVSDRDDENLISTLNSDGLYAVALDAGTPASKGIEPPSTGSLKIRIDLEGFMSRAVEIPVTPSSITALAARPTGIYFQTNPVQLLDGQLAGTRSALHFLEPSTLEDRVLVEDLDNYSLSADGTVIVFRRKGVFEVKNASDENLNDGTVLDLVDLQATVDPSQEWAEMFENAWRLDRDVFFNEAMNGTYWPAVHAAYARYLPSLGSQDDFLYLLGQMQGEIASSHTFLAPGPDSDSREPIHTGLLGADYVEDPVSHRYRFARIYAGDQTRPGMRGPLGVPGLAIREGDYLLAVDGHELKAPDDPDSLMAGHTGEVKLSVASSAAGVRRDVDVTPLTDDSAVRRHDWIEKNRATVNRRSAGRLGYVFLTDFNAEGSRDFVRQFYPQRDKEGLIIDVRWNRGGFTSQAVLDVLRRVPVGVFVNREGAMSTLPGATAPPVMVTVMNYASASDGDQFPYFFRKLGLGKLVGERTWGGVQGINRPWKLMDGSSITIPKDSLASLDGHWVIENEGVAPDIAVEPPPDEAITYQDSELEVAIDDAMEQLKLHPTPRPMPPAATPAYPPGGNVPGATFE